MRPMEITSGEETGAIYPSINIPHAKVESGCRQYMDRSRLDARGVKIYGSPSGATIK